MIVENRKSCPFNIAIDCTMHERRPVPDLPACCSTCGWNPAEAERRKSRLEQEMNTNAETATPEDDNAGLQNQ